MGKKRKSYLRKTNLKIRLKFKQFALYVLVLMMCGGLIFALGGRYLKNYLLDYPSLSRCLKASMSKRLLCKKSAYYVTLKEVSPYFLKAVVTSEDDKFYLHKGFDWAELKNSVFSNLRHFSFVRGGSTITQQLVKNVYLSKDKTLWRKLKEAVIAADVEKKFSKSLILEKYINTIQFGKNIWGIKQAARYYFDAEPSDLGVLPALYLTVLLPSPERYSKSFYAKKLTLYQKRRIQVLLRRLKHKGVLDQAYYDELRDEISDFPWEPKVDTLVPLEIEGEKNDEGHELESMDTPGKI